MIDPNRVLHARQRTRLRAFVRKAFEILNPGTEFLDNWHIDAIAYELERCARGYNNRLIINASPRSLKSEIASVILPAWLLGLDPSKKIITVSHTDDLARKFARDRRKLMESEEYRALFPDTRISAEKNTEVELVTTCGGGCYATGIDGSLRGRGADVIIIDDPNKSASTLSSAERKHVNRWYSETLYSRLNSKRHGVIILVMQRVHAEDLTGYVMERDDWEHLVLPAIAPETKQYVVGPSENDVHAFLEGEALHPEREDLNDLQNIARNIGTRAFQSQYLQNPTPEEGNLIRAEWIQRYGLAPDRVPSDMVVQSWDTASSDGNSNAYSVCTTWLIRRDVFYLMDVFRKRLNFPDLVRTVVDLRHRFQPRSILIENASSGQALLASLLQKEKRSAIPINPKGSKFDRMMQASLPFELGCVLLPTEAPWLGEFESELLGFPDVKFSDQVDSVSQFLCWIGENQQHQKTVMGAGPNTICGKHTSQYFGKTHPQRDPKKRRR